MQLNMLNNSALSRLLQTPHYFDFFQAVLLLEKMAQLDEHENFFMKRIRFKVAPALSFPAAELQQIKKTLRAKDELITLTVNFFGLTGPCGILPDHYTELLIARVQEKDTALQDFLDLFHHQLLTTFYASWKKYRIYLNHPLDKDINNKKAQLIFKALVGNATPQLAHRAGIPEQALYFYADILNRRPRSADGLATILAGYFNLQCSVEQFCGRWLDLDRSQQTQLNTHRGLTHSFAQLGITTLLGKRAWDKQGKFRVHITQLSYAQFMRLLPIGEMFHAIRQFTQFYAGMEYDFDLQLTLKASELPAGKLLRQKPCYLGWNTWLHTTPVAADPLVVILNICTRQ